jgi:hypothetical protein
MPVASNVTQDRRGIGREADELPGNTALELPPVLEVVSFLKNWSELTVLAFRGVT